MAVDVIRAIIDVPTFKIGANIDPNEDANEEAIQILINAVSVAIDNNCNRQFMQKIHTDYYIDGSGQKTLALPGMPATVTNLYYDDTLLTAGKDNDYIVYGDEGDGYIYKTSGVWADSRQIVKIGTLTIGYTLTTIPHDIKLACMKQSEHEYKRLIQSSWGETARSFGEGSINLEIGALMQSVIDILSKYELIYG